MNAVSAQVLYEINGVICVQALYQTSAVSPQAIYEMKAVIVKALHEMNAMSIISMHQVLVFIYPTFLTSRKQISKI